MGAKLTFIHSGDLHLGAPFRGLRALSPAWAQRLARAIPEAYDRVIQTCIDGDVDFLLLAGDMFDTDKPSYAHFRHFMRGLERLCDAGIAVYMIPGNHDPSPNWHEVAPMLPENVRMMDSGVAEYALHRDADGNPLCLIVARGFSNQASDGSIADGMSRKAAEEACGATAPFAVGMLHSGLWMDPFKAPVSESRLLAADMDYWALGHIHKRYATPPDDPRIAFCGCIQGRDIKETGSRGCYRVTLEEGMPNKVEFVPTAQVEWEQLCVDVGQCAGLDDIRAACVRAMFDANAAVRCDEMVARITIGGSTPLFDVLSRPGVMEELRAELNESYPAFFCDALVNATSSPMDKDALRSEGLFPAALLRASKAMRSSSAEDEGAVACGGKHARTASDFDSEEGASDSRKETDASFGADDRMAYLQEEFARRGLALPQGVEQSLDDLTESACDYVLALLDGRQC